MKKIIYILALIIILVFTSCDDEIHKVFNVLFSSDRHYPMLEGYDIISLNEVKLKFNEPIKVLEAELRDNTITYKLLGSTLFLYLEDELSISKESILSLTLRDESYNSISFSILLKGTNKRIPKLFINEFSSRASSTQPSRIELEFYSSGNTEGLYLADGTKGNESFYTCLPSIEVKAGDYLVLYWDNEIDEDFYINKTSTTTYNIAAYSPTNLSTNNGVFVIYENKAGNANIIDAICYTNRQATTFSGFGNSKKEKSYNELISSFSWIGEAIDSSTTTTTRTISRYPGEKDTNTNKDYYVCATRKESFGEMNIVIEYEK